MKKFFTHTLPYGIAFWAVLLFILILVVDFVVMPFVAGQYTNTIEVPDVEGMNAEKAESLLHEKDLGVIWSDEGKFSALVPAGHILVQMPKAGRTVKDLRNIKLTVSKGMREVTIPSLRGKSVRQAEISLNRLGLVLGKKLDGAHVSIPRGVVIRSVPAAGKVSRVGEVVDLVISSGARSGRERMPDLTGQSLSVAQNMLDSLSFELGEVTREKDTTQVPNTILRHSPRRGEFLDSGTVIDLVIAE